MKTSHADIKTNETYASAGGKLRYVSHRFHVGRREYVKWLAPLRKVGAHKNGTTLLTTFARWASYQVIPEDLMAIRTSAWKANDGKFYATESDANMAEIRLQIELWISSFKVGNDPFFPLSQQNLIDNLVRDKTKIIAILGGFKYESDPC